MENAESELRKEQYRSMLNFFNQVIHKVKGPLLKIKKSGNGFKNMTTENEYMLFTLLSLLGFLFPLQLQEEVNGMRIEPQHL